jgi:MFS family permease
MRIIPKKYIWYKFFNSSFTGLSIGSIFTIYSPLEPSIYSIGGILLAVGMMIVAKFYEKIMTVGKFFLISMFVEFVILFLVIFFLIHPYTYMTALLIYAGYQLTFVFGAYLVRAETLILKRKHLLSLIDIFKQAGYLAGLVVSFVFYKILEYGFHISTNQEKVYFLHFLLLGVELIIIYLLYISFSKKRLFN